MRRIEGNYQKENDPPHHVIIVNSTKFNECQRTLKMHNNKKTNRTLIPEMLAKQMDKHSQLITRSIDPNTVIYDIFEKQNKEKNN